KSVASTASEPPRATARLRRARRPHRQNAPKGGAKGATPADGARGHRKSVASTASEPPGAAARLRRARRKRRQHSPEAGAEGAAPADGGPGASEQRSARSARAAHGPPESIDTGNHPLL